MKNNIWKQIENEFNSQSFQNLCATTVLKHKYENIKQSIKKQYANEKAFHRETRGPIKSFPGSVLATVRKILQTKITEETAIYDLDVMREFNLTDAEENIIDNDIIMSEMMMPLEEII